MTNENCCNGACEKHFEETEKGFKLEVICEDKEKRQLLKNLITTVRKLHGCNCN